MSDSTFSVQLESVTKRYGSLAAANAVSLEIQQGEFFTLLGSSGCGKTTLLRLIGGFEFPDEGRVLINGIDVSQLPAHKRDVHTVFQDYALFPHLTVFENVAYACRLQHLAKSEVQEKVSIAIDLVQLTGFEKRRPSELSGGQQQRVALARAIVDRPSVLLLDEPLSALDAKIRTEVREELRQLQRQTGITFVYVTHDQDEALVLSDRIAVIRGGRVLQVDTPIGVYERPADLFVASFIGRANFIPGILTAKGGKQGAVQTQDGRIEATLISDLPLQSQVRVMVRPENLRIGSGEFEATIQFAAYLGHSTEYILNDGTKAFRALEIRRRGDTPRAIGSTTRYGWSPEEALIYPAESDLR